jgi:hypothetical protein
MWFRGRAREHALRFVSKTTLVSTRKKVDVIDLEAAEDKVQARRLLKKLKAERQRSVGEGAKAMQCRDWDFLLSPILSKRGQRHEMEAGLSEQRRNIQRLTNQWRKNTSTARGLKFRLGLFFRHASSEEGFSVIALLILVMRLLVVNCCFP